MRLVFGVVDISYSDASGGAATTTGHVAEILESRYHVMETFYVAREDKIADSLADSLSNAIADVVSGARRNSDPFQDGMRDIEREFRDFLDANEMSRIVAGLSEGESAAFDWSKTFSSAANAGVRSRFKNRTGNDRSPRPVFVDTGLFQESFRAWVEAPPKES